MHNYFRRNRKALSSLAIILLLLIFAIIGGLISYLWVTGYYLSLKQKIPGEDIAVITNLSFNPRDAAVFNATVLNPSYSPYRTINVTKIAITGESENTLHYVATTPSLPFSLSRGTNQTFSCTSNWAQYVNQTVTVSAFVQSGSGSTSSTKLPYTAFNVTSVDFNSTLGVNNFTITLRNSPQSATFVNVTNIILPEFTPPINFTALLQPSLPITLFPNQSETLSCKYNWLTESEIGGSFGWLNVTTLQGYNANYLVQVPKLAASIQPIIFSPADPTHFNMTVENQVSTNTYLNVTRIRLLVNGTAMNVTTTPALSPSTNGVPRNQNVTFLCNWNWTDYRSTNVIATVYMLQGFNVSTQFTPPAEKLSITNAVFSDAQHILVTVQNSQYSTKPANVTMIQIQFPKPYNTSNVYPSLPLLVGIGNTTMFSVPWNWTSYTNTPIDILVYYYIHTNESYATYALTTPSSISNYQVYLSIPSATFNASLPGFNVTIHNDQQSSGNATITRIKVFLANGTTNNATCTSLPYTLIAGGNETFTCQWSWTNYSNKSIVILVYTDEGLKTIYITTTPS
jgi:hypothetical protein